MVEAVVVACAASGKSGGFLARNWCEGQPQDQLARISFDLHTDLAEYLRRDYGYRRVTTFAVATSVQRRLATTSSPPLSTWLDGECAVRGCLGDPATTAQLDPAVFTHALLDAARENGAVLRIGTVENVVLDQRRSRVVAVVVDGERIDADAVVVAMGPWTRLAAPWLRLPAVYGSEGYSIVLRNGPETPAAALFVEFEDEE